MLDEATGQGASRSKKVGLPVPDVSCSRYPPGRVLNHVGSVISLAEDDIPTPDIGRLLEVVRLFVVKVFQPLVKPGHVEMHRDDTGLVARSLGFPVSNPFAEPSHAFTSVDR